MVEALSWNKRQPTTKEELWNVLQEAWTAIPEDYLKKAQKAQTVLCYLVRIVQTFFLIYCISIHVCTCLNKCINLFPI